MSVSEKVFGGFLVCILGLAVVLSGGDFKTVDACTVIAVGKGASADGSVIVTHANDGMRDFRIVRVPGAMYAQGSSRPVFYDYAANGYLPAYGGVPYLRYVGRDRGPTYNTGQTPNIPLGYIPQVSETASYYEGTYPIMNVHQVSIGETTCQAKVEPMPDAGRLFYSASLARVVLERCDNAEDGVRLIGNLIETYGYHGTGECLVVADTEEIWVVEMCGYDMNGTGGLWVAKRVPDDAVFVSANQFRIREVDPNAPDMMYCENLFDICRAMGWWNPTQGKLDWLCAVSSGDFNHPYYSLRRVWRIFSLVKPSAEFPSQVANWHTKAYPFAVKPDQKLSVTDVMTLHRDVYEGTSFDLTKGLAAGSFGDPVRFDMQNDLTLKGAFERSVSYARCNYVTVVQARKWLPDPVGGRMWLGFNQADRNCFMPVHVGVSNMPESLDHGDYLHVDLNSAWWVFELVCETISQRYDMMIKDVHALQKQLEQESLSSLDPVEEAAWEQWRAGQHAECIQTLTRFSENRTSSIVDTWTQLWAWLKVRYLKNYLVDDQGNLTKMGYPETWLKGVGYQNGPTRYYTLPPHR